MSSFSSDPPWQAEALPDLLNQASSVLAREVLRLPGRAASPGTGTPEGFAGRAAELPGRVAGACPVSGVALPPAKSDPKDLRRQAHELVAGLFSVLGYRPGGASLPASSYPSAGSSGAEMFLGLPAARREAPAGRPCPVTGAAPPSPGFDLDQLRRQAHGFIETVLVTFNDATGEKGLPAEDQIPLLQCLAPVAAGGEARATFRVVNEDSTPWEVGLYATNFVADAGHEIPSARVIASPRYADIPPGGDVAFEIAIAVPQQAPAGFYSGLLQVAGNKYVKAVLSVEVL